MALEKTRLCSGSMLHSKVVVSIFHLPKTGFLLQAEPPVWAMCCAATSGILGSVLPCTSIAYSASQRSQPWNYLCLQKGHQYLLNYFLESAPNNIAAQERQISSKFKTSYLAHIRGALLMFEDTELKYPAAFAELR